MQGPYNSSKNVLLGWYVIMNSSFTLKTIRDTANSYVYLE